MPAKGKAPEILQLSTADLERLLAEVRPLLPPASYGLIQSLLRTLVWVMGLLEQKQTTIARLRRLIFGEKTEKTRKIFPDAFQVNAGSAEPEPKSKRKGHGRKGAKDYRGARRVKVPHPKLHLGDLCPKCLKGKLYLFSQPAQIIRVVAQPIFQAAIFELERLRCALCGALFTAPAPPEAGEDKHDPSVGNMLAVLRYGMGQPMYRTDKWQSHFGVPLPASTQWKLIAAAAPTPEIVYEALVDSAANGSIIHTDDTTMRVHSLRQEISEKEDSRTGIFTTGLISQVGPQRIALFFTGQKHAGENFDRTLKRRAAGLDKPIHMCDGLLRNISKEFETILCNCLCHGRRQVVDVAEKFPEQSRKIIEVLAEVYRADAQAKEQQLSDGDRLLLHQTQSKPILDELHRWMQEQLDQKLVEPNGGLGQAINYLLRRWQPLTRFLSVPGAPLDNNLAERGLKMAILHRKNSLAFLTLRGARVGDVFMSLIHYPDSVFIQSERSERPKWFDGTSRFNPDKRTRSGLLGSQGFQETKQTATGAPSFWSFVIQARMLPEAAEGVALHSQIGLQVASCRSNGAVAQIVPNHGQFDPGLKQRDGATVAQCMGMDPRLRQG